MGPINQLAQAWTGKACGVTIDIVGDSQDKAQLQWVIAIPLGDSDTEDAIAHLEALRAELLASGFSPVDDPQTSSLGLTNGLSLEPECPYRPEDCAGDHAVASGRGWLDSQALV